MNLDHLQHRGNPPHIYFPGDWIKPGEGNYCQRCGYHLDLAAPNVCWECRGLKIDDEFAARWEAATRRFFENIAAIRTGFGLPPLFWMLP